MYTMLGLIALTMAIIYLLPKLTKAVPAMLVGILVVAVSTATLGPRRSRLPDRGQQAHLILLEHKMKESG